MRAECIDAVAQAFGRSVTQVEARDIENRIRLSHRRLAAVDPEGWQVLGAQERLQRAGEDAAQALLHAAAKARHRVAMAILAHDRIANYIDAQVASGADANGIEAMERLLEGKADGKNNADSVHSLTHGIWSSASTFMTRSWNVAGGRFLKLLRDPKAEALLARALHGDLAVPKAFRDAAADFHAVAERLRQRFNAAGGDIGLLENWGMPHSWSRARLLKAGKDAWTRAMLPLLDRGRYFHEDGRSYTEAELGDFLGEAWRTVVTGGANKILGKDSHPGSGIKANRGSAERQIHLTDARAYMQAMGQFSERGVMDAMMGHIHRMARDIALVEQFGPNADRQFARMLDQEWAKMIDAQPDKRGKADRQARFATRLYNYLAGNGTAPPETMRGKIIQVWRDLNVLKLGATAVTSSIGDYGTMHTTAHVNGIPKFKMFLNEIRALNPLDKREKAMAASAGLMVREYSQQLARYGSDIGSYGWSSKLANTMLKVSLLPYVTEARRRAFSYGMMDQVGKAVREHESPATLNEGDQKFIKHAGIDEQDWQVMRLAEPDDFGGNHQLLTPESIYRIPDEAIAKVTGEHPDVARDKAASSLMGLVFGEQDRAVIEPGPKTRIRLGADLSADGMTGFLARSFSLFKSFSFEMIEQHMDRALHAFATKRGSAAYMAAIIASTTVCGAIGNAIRDIISGRDPRTLNLTTQEGWKNWASALATGGGFGIYGDFLINTYGSHGNSIAETIGGPMVGDASVLLNAVQQTIASSTDPQADMAEKLRPVGASVVRSMKSYIPGATLFYTRAAFDRLIFDHLSDYLSPGYLNRMKSKARAQHRTYWWEPDKPKPKRAPDLSTVAR
jgi:hypothetical protein